MFFSLKLNRFIIELHNFIMFAAASRFPSDTQFLNLNSEPFIMNSVDATQFKGKPKPTAKAVCGQSLSRDPRGCGRQFNC